jgi:micrococcal nuclease
VLLATLPYWLDILDPGPAVEAVPARLELPDGLSFEDLAEARVVNIVDGDTIDVTLDGRTRRIRYYGSDTPERGEPCFGEATDRNETLAGTTVLLLPDARDIDRFDRLLRYVFTPDGRSIDATMVAEGFSHAWREDGRYRDQIVALEAEAQAAGRGCLWR